MESSQHVQPEITPPASHTPSAPPFEWKRLEFVIPIIFSIVGFAACGAGLAGFFQVGALSNLGQVNALILMSAGGGAGVVFLVDAILAGVKQRISSYEVPYHNTYIGFTLSHIPIFGQSIDIYYQKLFSERRTTLVKTLDLVVESLKLNQKELETHIKDSNSNAIEMFWEARIDSYEWTDGSEAVDLILKSCPMFAEEEGIQARLEEIAQLKGTFVQTRINQYSSYIKTLARAKVLEEAKRFYLNSFPSNEKKGIEESIEQATLHEILPKMKERCPSLPSKDCVEMAVILVLFGP